MNFDDYQNEARRTASNQGDKVAIFALGLCGEAGEVADLIKKWKGHGHDLDKSKITKELGDVLWYLANLADQLGINLDVIAQGNVAKLRARYPNGFSVEASKVKADEAAGVRDPLGVRMVLKTLTKCPLCGQAEGHYGEPCPALSAPTVNVILTREVEAGELVSIPRGPELNSDLAGLAAREAQPWPQAHGGSPEVVGWDANGAPIDHGR